MRKRITLRIPEALYEELKQEAKRQGISVNDLILIKLSPIDKSIFEI